MLQKFNILHNESCSVVDTMASVGSHFIDDIFINSIFNDTIQLKYKTKAFQ